MPEHLWKFVEVNHGETKWHLHRSTIFIRCSLWVIVEKGLSIVVKVNPVLRFSIESFNLMKYKA